MAVKEWIGEFLERHKARFDPHDWPAAEAAEERLEYTRTWVTAFSLKSITRDEADEASRPSDENRIAKTYAAYCVCALGRWTRHNHAQHSPDLLHRIPDFEHVLAGGSAYLAEPPAVIAKGGWPS
jgi:hypothetical protein